MQIAMIPTEATKPEKKAPVPSAVQAGSLNAFRKPAAMTEKQLLEAISKTYGDVKVSIRVHSAKNSQEFTYLPAKTVGEAIELFKKGKYAEEKAIFIEKFRKFEKVKHKIPLGEDFAKLTEDRKDYYRGNVSLFLRKSF